MPAKKKKAAEQAAELERLAEEQRLAEIAEQERLEKERLEREERERLAAEEAARLQAELDARMAKEAEEQAGFYEERARRLKAELDEALEQKDWKRYLACGPLPDTSSEAAVNESLTEWRDRPVGELEPTLDECELAHQLLAELRSERLQSSEMGMEGQAEWQGRLSGALGEVLLAKLDEATADFLQVAENHANAKNECLVCLTRPSCKFGLWVNLAKNPRLKQVDYPGDVKVSTELPKSLALASVAIRVVHYMQDRLTSEDTTPYPYDALEGPLMTVGGAVGPVEKDGPVTTLGGVLTLELLALPAPTKKVKGWTLRQVSEQAGVVRQQYPAPMAGADSAALVSSAPQLRISYELPSTLVMPEGPLKVGWWEPEGQAWHMEGVAEVEYAAETRTLSFLTPRLCSVALLQKTSLELPYKNWLLSPEGAKRCRLSLQTQRFLVEMEVSAQGVTLRAPRLPELTHVLDQPMAPTRLLQLLKQSGINLAPKDEDCPMFKKNERAEPKPLALVKLSELERDVHEHLAPLLCSLQVAPSRWCQGAGKEKCLYRVAPKKEALDLDEETGGDGDEGKKAEADPFAVIEGSWQTLMVRHQSVGGGTLPVKALDSAKACDEAVLEGQEAHSTPLLCLQPGYPDLVDELKLSPMLYQDTLRQLLNCLRLFSFTVLPEPVEPEK